MVAGQCAMFAGHRLAYGAAPNASGRTVVSLDFHVVPWSLYSESREKARRSSHDLRLGGYYALMTAAPLPVPSAQSQPDGSPAGAPRL